MRRVAWALFIPAVALAPVGIALGVVGERRGLDLPPDRGSKLLVEAGGGDRRDVVRGGRAPDREEGAPESDRLDLPRLGADARADRRRVRLCRSRPVRT